MGIAEGDHWGWESRVTAWEQEHNATEGNEQPFEKLTHEQVIFRS